MSDYANRLPRGRTYVRNGSVADLHIERGTVHARVSGSELYTVKIGIATLPRARWSTIVQQCNGQIDSLVELLSGRLSDGVMKVITEREHGLFPRAREISLSCSCPDYATLCKHVAAVLYGLGARLDTHPALLFTLRGVDHAELIAVDSVRAAASRARASGRVVGGSDLAEMFGIEMDAPPTKARMAPGTKGATTKGVRDTKRPETTPRTASRPASDPSKPTRIATGSERGVQPTQDDARPTRARRDTKSAVPKKREAQGDAQSTADPQRVTERVTERVTAPRRKRVQGATPTAAGSSPPGAAPAKTRATRRR